MASGKSRQGWRAAITALAVAGATVGLTACEGWRGDSSYESTDPAKPDGVDRGPNRESIFGSGGVSLLGNNQQNEGGGSLGVNSFLWRATLDTISFMPVTTADPFGGVILTDWHSTADAPNERFKLNVYILGRTLRADGIRVAVFSQVKDGNGGWADSEVPNQTGTKIEDAILTRARQLRRQTLKKE